LLVTRHSLAEGGVVGEHRCHRWRVTSDHRTGDGRCRYLDAIDPALRDLLESKRELDDLGHGWLRQALEAVGRAWLPSDDKV